MLEEELFIDESGKVLFHMLEAKPDAMLTITGNVDVDGQIEIELEYEPILGDTCTPLEADDLSDVMFDSEGFRGDVFLRDVGDDMALVTTLEQGATEQGPDRIVLVATAPGDANGDLLVDMADLGFLGVNWTAGLAFIFDEALAQAGLSNVAIPEPSTAMLLALAGLTCPRRSR